MYSKRFDKIVSFLEKNGGTVTGDGVDVCFDEHYREDGRIVERHVSGKIVKVSLNVDKDHDSVSVFFDMADCMNDFELQRCKGNLTVTERFMAEIDQDPETGCWVEDEVELDIEPEDGVFEALLKVAEHFPFRKETVYKEQLIVETDKGCFFYLYNADGDVEEYSAKNAFDAVNKIDERLADEGLYDADGNINKNI